MTDDAPTLVPCDPGALTPTELRTLFLFEKLTDEQLAWIAEHGCAMHMPAGGVVIREGDPADQFFVLLSGTISLTRKVGQDEVETVRTEQRGVYMGATQAYLRDDGTPRTYTATDAGARRLPTSSCCPAADFGAHDARVVPDGDPPARGPGAGHAQLAGGDRRAGAADRARRALRRA